MARYSWLKLGMGALAAALTFTPGPATARQRVVGDPGAPQDAALVVDGVVREVFRSDRRSQVDYILMVEVTSADLGPNRKQRVLVPAPGEVVYVHAAAKAGDRAVPAERSQVRLGLTPRDAGGWSVAPDAITLTSREPAPSSPLDPEPPAAVATTAGPAPAPTGAPATAAASPADLLGVEAESIPVQGRVVLKVNGVKPDGPAGQAGIEPGDIIAGVDNAEFRTLDDLGRALRKGPEPTLVVVNVRTGKPAMVKVDLKNALAAETRMPAPSAPAPTPAPAPAARTLGVGVKPVRIAGGRAALEVVEVAPDGAAGKAGIEKGDLIAAVDNQPTTTADQLAETLRRAGDTVTVLVVDNRSGKSVPVEVALGAAPTGAPRPGPDPTTTPAPSTRPAPAGRTGGLGVVTEQVTVEFVPALKVVQVAPGSPAEKAGLEVGDVIFAANDVITIVPELLDKAVKESGPELKLSVLGRGARQKSDVTVKLR